MIPQGLAEHHFHQATQQIDREGVPHHRASVHYDLLLNGKKYPPKYVISLATKFATGIQLPSDRFNAVEARDFFLRRHHVIVDRRGEPVKDIIPVVFEDDESDFAEGRKLFQLHRYLERDGKFSRNAKARRLRETGKLACDVCGMDFHSRYGELGKGFIEAHHKKPISVLDGKSKTRINDLAMVCSNCHRMLHRGKQLLDVEELKALVEERQDD